MEPSKIKPTSAGEDNSLNEDLQATTLTYPAKLVDSLSQQKLSRREFLAFGFASILSIVGIGGIITALKGQHKDILGSNKSTVTYGGVLANVGDVNISSPTSNQILGYSSADKAWTNISPTLKTLSDVSIYSPQSNQVLTYNSVTRKWSNTSNITRDLSYISGTSPTSGNVSLNDNQLTNLAKGTSSTDAATVGQIPLAGTTSGTYAAGNDSRITGAIQAGQDAGGDLSGTYPNPKVSKLNGVSLPDTAPNANQVLTASSDSSLAWQTLTNTAVFDVQDYGAKGDGSTDDTDSIQSAWSALVAASGGTLYFPQGTYVVHGLVFQNASKFKITGEGGASIVPIASQAAHPSWITNDIVVVADSSDFLIEDLIINGLRDTLAPINPLTSSVFSGQSSVNISSGQGSKYVVGQRVNVYGGLYANGGDASTNTMGADANLQDFGLVIESISSGINSDIITFTTNLSNSYTAASGTISDGFGPFAANGAYITPYQTGLNNSVAGRTLGNEDQQNGLHLMNCQRFVIDSVESFNLWESPIKCGTGFAANNTSINDGCSEGSITNCIVYHGYDQGISLWLSQRITVTGNIANATGWAGISLSGSDFCVAQGNTISSAYYRPPGDDSSGSGMAIEGGTKNILKQNVIYEPWSNGLRVSVSPLSFGINTYSPPTITSTYSGHVPPNTSVAVSDSSIFVVGAAYSIVAAERTEKVTVASIVDGSHITFVNSTRFEHFSGEAITSAVAEDNIIEGNIFHGAITGHGINGSSGVRTIYRSNDIQYSGFRGDTYTGTYAFGICLIQTSFGNQSLGGEGSIIDGNTIGANWNESIIVDTVNSIRIQNNEVLSPQSGSWSLHLRGVSDGLVSGNYIHDNYSAGAVLIEDNSSSQPSSRLTINSNVIIKTNDNGIRATTTESLTITDNIFWSCKGSAAIDLQGATHSVVSGNVCESNQGAGILLENSGSTGATYSIVKDNICRDNNDGFDVQTGSIIHQQYGIQENGNSDYNQITDNEADANSVSQIVWSGPHTRINGNTGTYLNTYELVVSADQPDAWWKLDDISGSTTAADYSGHSHGGTASNVAFGQPGALTYERTATGGYFNGTSAHVDIDSYNPAPSSITLELWLNFPLTGIQNSGEPRVLANSHTDSDGDGFMVTLANDNQPKVYFGSSGVNGSATTPDAVNPGYHHVVATWDGSTILLYVDGRLTTTTSFSGTLTAGTSHVGIGYNPAYSGDYFLGDVAHVAIYTKVLSAERITAHYLSGAYA